MKTKVVAMGFQQNWWTTLTSPFMRNALIGGTVVALAAGLIGSSSWYATPPSRRMHLPTLACLAPQVRVFLGLPVTLGLGVFCLGGALVIGYLGRRASEREVVTGTVLSFAMGLGLFFNSLASRNSGTMTNVLFRNVRAVSHEQLVVFAILSTTAFQLGQRPGRPSQGATGADVVHRLHGITWANRDDGDPGRGYIAVVRTGRHTGGDRHHAYPPPSRSHGRLDGHQRDLGLGWAGRLRHVQPSAQLFDRHLRVRNLAGGVAEGSSRQNRGGST